MNTTKSALATTFPDLYCDAACVGATYHDGYYVEKAKTADGQPAVKIQGDWTLRFLRQMASSHKVCISKFGQKRTGDDTILVWELIEVPA